jgi:predicted SnoaL-like aldol condensation-catalyzing enzyme
MSAQHKAAARAVFDTWNDGRLERLDALVAPHVLHHDPYDPHGAQGLAGMKQRIVSVRARFPDLRLTVVDQVAEDDLVATRWTGRLARDRAVTGITIDRFEHGKIVEAWRSIVALNASP